MKKINFVAISTKASANPIKSFGAGMTLWGCPVLGRYRAFIVPHGHIFGCGLPSPPGSEGDLGQHSSFQPRASPIDSGEGCQLPTFPEIGKMSALVLRRGDLDSIIQHLPHRNSRKQHFLNLKLLTKRHVTEVTGLRIKGTICYLVTSTKKQFVALGKSLFLSVFSCKIKSFDKRITYGLFYFDNLNLGALIFSKIKRKGFQM